MPTPDYTLRCLNNQKIARDIYEFTLEKPDGFTFIPGQFVLIDFPLVENPADIQPRAFSIASTNNEKEILFVAKLLEGGRASRYIEEVLEPSSELRIVGPLGNFILDRETDKDYLCIATSTGVAPFRPQIISTLEEGDKRRIDLVFGVREEADLFWVEEFEKLAQDFDNFFLHLALSQPTDEWKGHKGRVQTLAPLIAKDFSNKNVYACVNPEMTNEVKRMCIEDWGVEKEDVHVEGYI